MRKIFIIIAILSLTSIALAGTMYIHLNDGTTEEIELNDINNITFSDTSNIVLAEDWETGVIDTSNTWNILSICDSTPAISSEYQYGGEYSLKMVDHTGYNSPQIQNKHEFNLDEGIIEFYTMENYDATSGACNFVLKDVEEHYANCNPENILCRTYIGPNDSLYVSYIEDEPINLCNINFDQWYKISIQFDIISNSLIILVDNVQLYSGPYNPDFSTSSFVNYFQIAGGSYFDQGPEFYVDNILIKQ